MSVYVTMPTSAEVMAATLPDAKRLEIMTALYEFYFEFIPRGDSGALSTTVDIQPDYIEHLVPYAHRQYTGETFNFRQDTHPLATAYWDRVMLTSRGQAFMARVQAIIGGA